ncbi:unnamed protein product, partial [Symbiodinium sp. CCMP2456]
MEGLPEVPTLFRSLEGRQASQVHVDDMMMTGDTEPTDKVIDTLKGKYEMKVQGPFGSPGDEWNFLNRRYTLEEDLSITVRPDARFYSDIYEMLGQPRARSTPGPGGGDSLFNVDATKAISDSNFANDRETRKSLSSGQVYVNNALVYSFVRNQKVVTLSSGEAELVALTQTVSEAVLIKKAWAFLVDGPVEMIARTDSSVARAIAQRAGVGRVRHLQTSCLWIQMWTASKELKVLSIPTETNPADAGTKVLTGARLKKLCGLMGMVDGSGNAIKDDSNYKPKSGKALKVLMMVQALLASQLEGCDGVDDAAAYTSLDYLLETFYVVGYMLNTTAVGYLYVLGGITVMVVVLYLFFGARWRFTFVLENRSFTTGLGPGYESTASTSEGASPSASREDAAYNTEDAQPTYEDTFSYSKFVEHFFGKGTCGFHFFDFDNAELDTEVWLAGARGYAFH